MDQSAAIHLRISLKTLDDFCIRVRDRARNASDALQSLSAVQSFISQAAPAAAGDVQSKPLRECLDRHLDAVRENLLRSHAAILWDAIQQHRIEPIADSYTRLSRSGFRQAVAWAIQPTTEAERQAGEAWVRAWLADVTGRAKGAYPDALDFAAAGVEPAAFMAASDLYAMLEIR